VSQIMYTSNKEDQNKYFLQFVAPHWQTILYWSVSDLGIMSIFSVSSLGGSSSNFSSLKYWIWDEYYVRFVQYYSVYIHGNYFLFS
jgi:hypothetical protein